MIPGTTAATGVRPRAALFPALLGLVLLPGCGLLSALGVGTMVGPDYEVPETTSAERWIDYRDPRIRSQEADLRTWWKVFGDPGLDALMAKAVGGNLTLRAAAERVAAARARRDLAAGYQYPQVQGASGGAGVSRLSEETANTPSGIDRTVSQWDVGVGAIWEIDFWGRYGRGVQAADAELEASVAEHDDVLVLLYADVASRYVSYRTLQERLRCLRENVKVQEGAYQIAQDRFNAGAVSERDVHEARQVLEQTRARIPAVERDLRADANALCILTGSAPRDLAAELGDRPIPSVPAALAVGIPADLVRRRPDVRRAERIAAARCALIGVAEADYYPSFSLSGSVGLSAEHLSDLGSADALTSSLGLSFRWSILDWGRTASNVAAHEADFRAAVLVYQEAVLRAGAEVEDALVAFLKAQETLEPRNAAVAAATRTVEICREQYNQGEVDFSTVFLFTGSLTEQQDLLAATRGDAALAVVDLYRSLGGGWAAPPPEPPKEKAAAPAGGKP